MFYIALCDDNPFDLAEMTAYLADLKGANIRVESMTYSNGVDLIQEHKNGRRFHLIVLDMLMSPLNGIETAKQIRRYDAAVPILIVTSTVQYALDGYQINAWRYLMKPVDRGIFIKEITAILKAQEKADQNYFLVSNEAGITKVRLDDILYFESDQHVIKLKAVNDAYLFRGTLGSIEEKLEQQHFLRVHKSFLVNMKYVKNIFKNVIKMENGDRIFVSKNRSPEIYAQLLNYTEQAYATDQ